MSNKYIALIDSGIGGIPLLSQLVKSFPSERFIYFGDNLNAPYGSKRPSELMALTSFNLSIIKEFPLKAVILACNTLSVTIRPSLEQLLCLPVFGVFPPIFGAEENNCKTLLLATPLTCKQFVGRRGITVVSLPNLAIDIENSAPNFNSVDFKRHFNLAFPNNFNYKFAFEKVILGCTHYDFIKKSIFDHICPKKIVSSTTFTFNALKNYLKSSKSSLFYRQIQPIFLGKCADKNRKIFEKVVF